MVFSSLCCCYSPQKPLFLIGLTEENFNLKKSSDRLVIAEILFLKLPELHMLLRKKNSTTSQKLSFQDFWSIANRVLNKGKSAIPPLFNSMKVLSSTSDKTKLFAKSFLITLKLMTQVFLYLFLILELILNNIIFP